MTERPAIETEAPLVPEMPTTRVRADGGRTPETESGAKAVLDEAGAPMVPDIS